MPAIAIVPAAGKAERFGSPKLVADLKGEPLIDHTLASLLPQQPGPRTGGRHLLAAVENVIETVLQNRFLTRQRLSPVHVARDVQLRCREDALPVPSERGQSAVAFGICRRSCSCGADSDTRQHSRWRRCEEDFLTWTNRSA